MTRTRVAAIDCGTNSIRLLVSDVSVDGGVTSKQDVVREMRIVRLGQDVDTTGHLADDAVARTISATREYAELISVLGATEVRFCATSAARDADNAEDFGDQVESVLGVRPVVLTGEAEAAASFRGAVGGIALADGPTLLTDIGGGSTELIVGTGERIDWSVSLDVGSVRLTERFLASDPPGVGEIADCIGYLDGVLDPVVAQLDPVTSFVGVAGTVTTVAAHALALTSYDSDAIHLSKLHTDDVAAACLSLVQMSVADRRALPFMHPGRADVIGAGALILDRLVQRLPLATTTLVVSEHDILDGIVWSVVEG